MAESWAPTLDDVARHVPTRTRDTRTPGSDRMLGTFTEATTPTAEQAQAILDDAVSYVLAECGTMPDPLSSTGPVIRQAARAAAEWRAAADIEVAYPVRDADVRVYAQLDLRAKDALAVVRESMLIAGTGAVEPVPVWQAPLPVPWGDQSPGSGIAAVR